MGTATARATPPPLQLTLLPEPPRLVGERRVVNVHEVVVAFLRWAREEGFTGWMLAGDMDIWLVEFQRANPTYELPLPSTFSAALVKAPGVKSDRRRIGNANDRILRGLWRRVVGREVERPKLFYIASADELREAPRASAGRRRTQVDGEMLAAA